MNGGKTMERERRKISILEKDYIVMKPSSFGGNGQWEQKGRRFYNIRQLYDFMSGKKSTGKRNYQCVIESMYRTKIRQQLRQEIRRRKGKIRAYHEVKLMNMLAD